MTYEDIKSLKFIKVKKLPPFSKIVAPVLLTILPPNRYCPTTANSKKINITHVKSEAMGSTIYSIEVRIRRKGLYSFKSVRSFKSLMKIIISNGLTVF